MSEKRNISVDRMIQTHAFSITALLYSLTWLTIDDSYMVHFKYKQNQNADKYLARNII